MKYARAIRIFLLVVITALSAPGLNAQRAKNCPLCYGTGKCQTCYGKGGETHHFGHHVSYRQCGACSGTGRCHHCNGSGLDPNQSYAADAADIPSAVAGGAAGGENMKRHVVEARDPWYKAKRFTTNDEKEWLYEAGSEKIIADGWELLENLVQYGEDANYWFLRAKNPHHMAPGERIAVPKNSYGDVMLNSGDGSWSTIAYKPHSFRFVEVDYNGYSYQKTFQGPTWRKMALPYGGTGVATLVGICKETGEDDNYWYITDGSSTIKLMKTGGEVGKRTSYSPPIPTEPQASDGEEEAREDQEIADNDGENALQDTTRPGNSIAGAVPVWIWFIIILLSMCVALMGTYIFMARRQILVDKSGAKSTAKRNLGIGTVAGMIMCLIVVIVSVSYCSRSSSTPKQTPYTEQHSVPAEEQSKDVQEQDEDTEESNPSEKMRKRRNTY